MRRTIAPDVAAAQPGYARLRAMMMVAMITTAITIIAQPCQLAGWYPIPVRFALNQRPITLT